jgi:pSer/pThr/pTyr-binding forkhead associated (FHA) protein
MADLTLEIVEGPGAGSQMPLDRPVVIGRGADADLVLEDGEASRQHARITPQPDGSAVVEDLGSANGTFVNHNELYGPARVDAGDELLIGVTLLEVRSREQIAREPSGVRVVPQALAMAPRVPAYVNPDVVDAETAPAGNRLPTPQLDRYLDVRVRRRAQLAPLALFALIALALIVYFATR